MALVKIYAGLSGAIGVMEVVSGLVATGAIKGLTPVTVKLFNTFGLLGAFGPVELFWLAVSTVAAVVFVKKSVPFIPPVLYIAFCLLHPAIQVVLPDGAASNGAVTDIGQSPSSVVGIIFGALYVMLNFYFYKSYFLAPRLFEK